LKMDSWWNIKAATAIISKRKTKNDNVLLTRKSQS
jgi:hypothetical protein